MNDRPVDPISIDVGGLVQHTVASLYAHLVTRQTGRAVRLAIEARLADAGDQALSLIDLSEVSILDYSCADEVVAKLLQRYRDDAALHAYFVFRGVHEPHRDQIEVVLHRQSLAAVAETGDGTFELLGVRSAEEAGAWSRLESRGALPSEAASGEPDLMRHLEILAARRLVFRSRTDGTYHALSRLVRHLF
ncbi:MAG: hypothetical protein RH859_01415 [Longimicrobiales bacterium]